MPVPTPTGYIFDDDDYAMGDAREAGTSRERLAAGADLAAREAEAWTTFGDELGELVSKLQSPFGPLSGLTSLPKVDCRSVVGPRSEIPTHGVDEEVLIRYLVAVMRDSRAIGAAYHAAGRRLAAAAADPDPATLPRSL